MAISLILDCEKSRATIKHRLWFVGILVLLLFTAAACSGADPVRSKGVKEGNQAPDFTLESLDGGKVSLSQFSGQVVLVNFWATWCPPCRAEIPDLETAYQSHWQDGLVVLGVDVSESREAVEPFVKELEMTYPVLLDEAGHVFKAYRVSGLPMSVIVDREGVIRVRHTGQLAASQLERYLAQLLP
jgi:peroxiredoxin